MTRSERLSSFEGLRGIASVVVLLFHLHLTFSTTSREALHSHLAACPAVVAISFRAAFSSLFSGQFAVWLFWIMSAFVLSWQFFLRVREAPSARAHDYLEGALLRRYPRLAVPVIASVAFAYLIQAAGWMQNARVASLLGDSDGTSWLGAQCRFPASLLGAVRSAVWDSFFSYEFSTTYNSNLWTMEKEFFGSLFLFAFLALLGHRGSRFFVYPLVVAVNARCQLHWLNAFVAGIWLCDLFVNHGELLASSGASRWRVLRWIRDSRLMAALLWGLILRGAGLGNVWGVGHLAFGCAAIALTLASNPTQRLLSSPIFLFLGKISFGLYLIHLPVILSFSCWAYLETFESLGSSASALLVSAATGVISVALGYLFYVAVDRPAVGLSRRLSSPLIGAPREAVVFLRVPGEPDGPGQAEFLVPGDVGSRCFSPQNGVADGPFSV